MEYVIVGLIVLIVLVKVISHISVVKKMKKYEELVKSNIDNSRISYLGKKLLIDNKTIVSFISIELDSEIVIYNPYTAYNHYGGKRYQEQPKKKKLVVLEEMVKNYPNYNHVFVLLQSPFKIKAYYNESEIKTLSFGEKVYNYKFEYYNPQKITLENTFDF